MKSIYIQALMLLDQRIKDCGLAIRESTDEFTLLYWRTELAAVQSRYRKVMNRSKIQANVVHVDFINRKRAA